MKSVILAAALAATAGMAHAGPEAVNGGQVSWTFASSDDVVAALDARADSVSWEFAGQDDVLSQIEERVEAHPDWRFATSLEVVQRVDVTD